MAKKASAKAATESTWEREARAKGSNAQPRATHLYERLRSHERAASAAVRDRAKLVGVMVGERAISREEIERFATGVRETLAFAQRVRPEADETPSASAPDEANPETLSVAGLRKAQRRLQGSLLRAFDLRFAENGEGRALLADIRKGRRDDDLLEDTRRIEKLAKSDAHRDWFAALTQKEPAALAQLLQLDAQFRPHVATRTAVDGSPEAIAREADLAALGHMMAMLDAAERRLVLAGKYVFHGQPQAKDYRRFRAQRKARKTASTKTVTA